ncbi:MAG TPA: RHS repeat-associated core domain-containing protein, partial [Propionibacteriaceae bacterium]|nr:RHS repeat-associated core domain-containing protein [Propionibacteriaceae bacterium]
GFSSHGNWTESRGSLKLKDGATDLASWSYLYDKNYRQTKQSWVNGQAGSGGGLVTGDFTYAYDDAGPLSSFTQGATMKTLDWDADGNRLQYGDQDFTYNADDSIKTATDPSGANLKTFTYAPFGGISSDGCNTHQYDGFDRLTQVAEHSGSGCPTPDAPVTYLYDALDRQRSRTQSSQTTALHYDGLGQGTTIETSASVDTFYAIGPTGTPKALRVDSASPTIEFLAHDGHGNITTITTAAASVKCTLRYDPFGNPVAPQGDNPCSSGSQPANSRFYRAGRRDTATGSYQLGSRTYDPGKAGFLTPDTYRNASSSADLSIGVDPLTRNTYSYVNGDPVNLIDPSGHKFISEGAGGWTQSDIEMAQHLNQPVTIQVGGESYTMTLQQSARINEQSGGSDICPLGSRGEILSYSPKHAGCGTWQTIRTGPAWLRPLAGALAAGATFIGCTGSTLGIGVVGCSIAAGAVGGAVTAGLDCPGRSAATCAKMVTIEAVAGAASGGVGAGIAGPAFKSVARSIIGGIGAGATHSATSQLLSTGRVDAGDVLRESVVGGFAGGILHYGTRLSTRAPQTARLAQDIAVDPMAPRALRLDRPIGLSRTQNEFMQSRISSLQEQGAINFRVNQQQVNISGARVGINRPDLQYTLNGQRFYEEFDRFSSWRGLDHQARTLANDPEGAANLFWVE